MLLIPGRALWGTAREAWRRGAVAYAGERAPRRLRQQLRWSALAAAHSSLAASWLEFLDSSSMRPFANANPMLVFKPFRPYLSASWTLRRRIEVLRATYGIVIARRGVLERALLQPECVELATLPMSTGDSIRISLGFDNRYRKEGEFQLSLRASGEAEPLLSLAFSLEVREGGVLRCFIGCLQGHAGAKDAIKNLTKRCHGLRPPMLLMGALQELAGALGVSEIKGAGSTIQVHRVKHLIHLPRIHALRFDYDRVWREAGAVLDQDGWFDLPLRAHRRSLEEMRSNKRAQYARRYAVLDNVALQITRSVGT